ncbi:hypothetical protein [Prescottella equi]|uniref:hypothetical protein n=1 Tax=Rhodococcus hoagii TaxID=43767 RepID=UPI0019FEA68F|nr:hypothetical protein [Prescottella equi]MBM4498224.1 hypothetical protein [Prescottella equi]MBM4498294.1 hypothetical protein [Prescottella equi]MBM4603119.1 hypothetical protein [Prescottella equi]MBM4603197.1 hypothetical protein [Prescottella equi]NKV21497.1 hypothetical protein [Prescottella equi]
MTSPTQVAHPWRAVARTVFAAVVGLASLIPTVILASGVPPEGLAAQAVAVCAAITRVLADPRVNLFMTRFLPWLSASPADTSTGRHRADT